MSLDDNDLADDDLADNDLADNDLEGAARASDGGMSSTTAPLPPSPRPRAEAAPLTGWVLAGAGLVLALANFMVALDTTIANVSIPNIAGGLAVSPSEGTWVITSYSVAEAISLPLTGWLAHRFGAVKTFVFAMVGFGLCSALCGLAPSLGLLVLFRILQGLTGGPMIPLSQVLLLRIFPKEKAGQALGLWATTTVVAPIAGPILGGVLCDAWSWPWVFYVNVPIALVCAGLAWRLVRPFETPLIKRGLDVVGLVLMVVWIGAFEILLDKGEELDWFDSKLIVSLAIVVGLALTAFMIWVLTDANPIINLRVFRSRGYSVATLVLCIAFGTYFAQVVLLPLWLQTNMGYTATWAGLAVAPQGVLAVVVSLVVARVSGKLDPRLLIMVGVLWIAGVLFLRAGYASNVDMREIMLHQLAQGAGVACFIAPIYGLALGSLAPVDAAGGAGLLSFMRTLASAFAVSMVTTAWSDDSTRHRVALLNQADSSRAVGALASTGLGHDQTIRQFDAIVQNQSVMLATDQVFLALGVLMALSAGLIWLAPRPLRKAAAGAAH